MRAVISALALFALAADFADVNPNVFGPDDPRTKDLPKMMSADAKRRMQEACLRESKAFAAVTTKEQWEQYRDARIKALRESLGTFPEAPKNMRIEVTRKLEGDGFVIRNILYETRPGLWVSANLYLPTNSPEKMPGILISHAHHTPKTHGELQDMGMTWARSGVAVLVPDHLGHGERRQHDFRTANDFDKPFKVDRQDYYFRYNSNLQLSAAGESLMGWMVWDLMRGVDVQLNQRNIDPTRIILLGAVAGGGDPAGVTAALDPRIACVVPFNFGGWQPESSVTANPDRDFAWFGEGYWESTRGLRNGARDGFAHYVIVGSVAPRKVIYAHEFAWDEKTDPAWPRLQKIFGLYDAKDSLRVAHGKGSVRGAAGPDNTHCTHIGNAHRKMIYPALKDWFGMPIPEEYSKRRPAEELMCWNEEVTKKLGPKKVHEVLAMLADRQIMAARKHAEGLVLEDQVVALQANWSKLLNGILPWANPKLIEGKSEAVRGGMLSRFALEVESGIVVPFLLITPPITDVKPPVVVMVAQAGKAALLKERGDALTSFLKAGVAVCLVDVRGTGETRPADSSPSRGGSRTSISQSNLILGRPVVGLQLRDLRTVIRWVQTRNEFDRTKLGLWGDSFETANPVTRNPAAPFDVPDVPTIGEPNGPLLALLGGYHEGRVMAIYTNGGLTGAGAILRSPYLYVPHEAIVPGSVLAGDFGGLREMLGKLVHSGRQIDGLNRTLEGNVASPAEGAEWMIKELLAK